MFIFKVHVNKNISIAKAISSPQPPSQQFCLVFITLILTPEKPNEIRWQDFHYLSLNVFRAVGERSKLPLVQPLENQLDTALYFLGKLENENEKALKPAKITLKSP